MGVTKDAPESLAVFGGRPLFDETLHVGRPNLGDRDRLHRRLDEILDRRWLTNAGPVVAEFEREIAALAGVRHCIATSNGTVALEIAARALGFRGEVIVPSFTFVATAHCLQWQEITPVFCDIDPDTHNIDPERIEALITPRTTGIIAVHLWGRPCAVERLEEIAARNGLRLLFDASHALCCTHRGRPVGGFGQAEVFSFHATKFVNAAEGGAVVTDDDGLAEKIRLMKNFGFVRLDTVTHVGTNGKMSELNAAMGLNCLEAVDRIVAANERNYRAYLRGLDGLPGVRVLRYDERERRNYQYVVLEVDEDLGITRDEIVDVLHAENVRARRYFYPGCHRMEPYRSYYPNAHLLLPETERIVRRVLCLPTGAAVSEEAVGRVCDLLRFLVENGPEIHRALARARGGDPA